MREVLLYGDLAKKFGKVHRYDVSSVREALSALSNTIKGFKQYMLTEGKCIHYIAYSGYKDMLYTAYNAKLTNNDPIRIIPVFDGSGGFFKAVLGIALIVVAPYAAPAIAGALGVAATTVTSALIGAGVSMVIGGITEMLYSGGGNQPQQSYESPENKPSYSFDGPINTIRQGNPVPVGYGLCRVGSQVISAGIESV